MLPFAGRLAISLREGCWGLVSRLPLAHQASELKKREPEPYGSGIPPMPPTLFVGSSTEALPVAEAV